MKNKFKLLFILLTIIFISLPSICFSESVTVVGEGCYVVTDDIDDVKYKIKPKKKKTKEITPEDIPPPILRITRKQQRDILRNTVISDGLMKIPMYIKFYFDYERGVGININKPIESQKKSSQEIREKYLENFKVISHSEKGRKMCEKVQFSIDLDVLQNVINSYEMRYYDKKRERDEVTDRLRKQSECRDKGYGIEYLLESYSNDKKRIINVGVIVENRTQNRSEVETEKLSDEVEKTLSECLSFSTTVDMNRESYTYLKTIPTNHTRIIERRYLNKILEEHNNLSVSGIIDGNKVKLGKLENLDVIFLRIIYDDKTTSKLLKVENGEVMYVY